MIGEILSAQTGVQGEKVGGKDHFEFDIPVVSLAIHRCGDCVFKNSVLRSLKCF